MKRRASILAMLGAGAAAAAAGVGFSIWKTAPAPPMDDATVRLFAMTLPDASGTPQPLAQWKGKLLVVNFWATWCPPCVEEMPDLQRMRDAYHARGVEIIGIGIDSAIKIAEFSGRLQLTLPLLVAGAAGSELGRALGNQAGVLPYTVLVARSGAVVQRKIGQVKPHELRFWLDAQLG